MTDQTTPTPEDEVTKAAEQPVEAPLEADMYEPIPADETPAAPSAVAAPAPAKVRKPRSKVQLVLTGIVVLLVIAVVGYGAMIANARWGRRAMVRTGVVAVESLIQGQADQLAAVSAPTVQAQLTAKVRNDMRNSGILADFGKPLWSGNSVVVTATTGMGPGMFVAGASADGADVVIYKTQGTLGFTTGALSFQRTWAGWRITGLSVKPTPASTATVSPSGAATASPTTATP